MSRNVKKLISPRVLCTSITNCVLSNKPCQFLTRFTELVEISFVTVNSKNVTALKLILVHRTDLDHFIEHYAQNRVLTRNVLRLIRKCNKPKKSQNSYLNEFCAQVSKIDLFLAKLTVLTACYDCMS